MFSTPRLPFLGFVALVGCSVIEKLTDESEEVGVPPVAMQLPSLDCNTLPEAAGTTYYVAANVAGASNEVCDGLSLTDEGGGHCPFRDFTSKTVREKLFRAPDGSRGTKGVTVVVAAGVYEILPMTFDDDLVDVGLYLEGTGSTPKEAVRLVGAPNELVTLSGVCPTNGAGCLEGTAKDRVTSVVTLAGSHTGVWGFRFYDAMKEAIRATGHDASVDCAKFVGPASAGTAALRAASGSSGIARANEFVAWVDRAVDLTDSDAWHLSYNSFKKGAATAIVVQGGATGVTIDENQFDTIAGAAIGVGSMDPAVGPFAAVDLVIEGNHVTGTTGPAVRVTSCRHCTVNSNEVTEATLGLAFEGPAAGCPECQPSSELVVRGNRLRDLSGAAGIPSDLFMSVSPTVPMGWQGGANLYCIHRGAPPAFRLGTQVVDLRAWQRAVTGETGSKSGLSGSAECAF